jgi:hypothetical protein
MDVKIERCRGGMAAALKNGVPRPIATIALSTQEPCHGEPHITPPDRAWRAKLGEDEAMRRRPDGDRMNVSKRSKISQEMPKFCEYPQYSWILSGRSFSLKMIELTPGDPHT